MKIWILVMAMSSPFVLTAQKELKHFSNADLKGMVGKYSGTLLQTSYADDKTQTNSKVSMEITSVGDSLAVSICNVVVDNAAMLECTSTSLSASDDGDELYYEGRTYEVQQVIHNGPKLLLRTIDPDENSKDNGKAAEIHRIFTITKEAVIILTEVKYENGKEFFMRSRYMFTKQ